MPPRPELYEDVEDVFTAFFWLNGGRQYNEVGPQPITLAEMVAYLDNANIRDYEERFEFQKLIRALDVAYLAHAHEQIARERERLLSKNK